MRGTSASVSGSFGAAPKVGSVITVTAGIGEGDETITVGGICGARVGATKLHADTRNKNIKTARKIFAFLGCIVFP
jgi:hypothetical protein